jgi:hypothetical protein
MQRDLILHIGLSKTGSSSIQRVLAGQRDSLQAQGVYMPQSPGWANHALLPASLVNDPRILWGFHPGTWEGLTPSARLARFRQEWAAELAALPEWATRCVITAEQIGGLLRTDNEVLRLAEELRPHFASIRVVVYLRRQDQHAASAYSQWLRGGILVEPALPDGGPAEQPEYDYGALLDRYAAAFGDAAMCPRIFDRGSLTGGDVVEDFMQLSGISLPIPPEAPKKNSNLGITLEGQNLLLVAGRRMAAEASDDLWRDTPRWRRLAEAVSETMPGRGWRPTRAEASAFMQRFTATNERARRRFFPHLPTLFPLDFEDLPLQPALASVDSLAPAALDVLINEITNSAAREAHAAMAQFRLLKRLEDRPAMRQALVRAIKFAPDLLGARLKAGEYFLEEGDLLQAREHAEAAHRIAPDDRQVERLLRRVERGTPRGARPLRKEAARA